MSSGSSSRTRRYISSRQVQKSSVGWPRSSARPAIARWNECECTLGIPGSTRPVARSWVPAGAPAVTRVSVPASSHSRRTSRAQPEGSSASAAWRVCIAAMIPAMARTLLVNGRIATMRGGTYSMTDDGAMVAEGGVISWVGPRELAPTVKRGADEVVDAKGALVTPGLVDCHTHLVYAGNRAREFEMRLEGASYEAIARAGGGIVSTVRQTR